jgi:hypothetical protein
MIPCADASASIARTPSMGGNFPLRLPKAECLRFDRALSSQLRPPLMLQDAVRLEHAL